MAKSKKSHHARSGRVRVRRRICAATTCLRETHLQLPNDTKQNQRDGNKIAICPTPGNWQYRDVRRVRWVMQVLLKMSGVLSLFGNLGLWWSWCDLKRCAHTHSCMHAMIHLCVCVHRSDRCRSSYFYSHTRDATCVYVCPRRHYMRRSWRTVANRLASRPPSASLWPPKSLPIVHTRCLAPIRCLRRMHA